MYLYDTDIYTYVFKLHYHIYLNTHFGSDLYGTVPFVQFVGELYMYIYATNTYIYIHTYVYKPHNHTYLDTHFGSDLYGAVPFIQFVGELYIYV